MIIDTRIKLNQNDFDTWLVENLLKLKDLEKDHITRAYMVSSLNRLLDTPVPTPDEYYDNTYKE